MQTEVENQVVDTFAGLPGSREKIDQLIQETAKDPVLKAVKKCIQEGWKTGACMAYAHFKDELCVVNGVILKGPRMVIPVSMRKDVLSKIHVGHLGAEKQKRMAREVVYWPNMNRDIDDQVQECGICQKYRPAHQKETYHSEGEINKLGPWEQVGVDLFSWGRDDYLLVVDYYSNYPEISKLSNTSSEMVITHLRSIFARHGIPSTMVSDNGPQFSSDLFRRFSKVYGFVHRTSSLKHPQANGQAERAVGLVKGLLNKAREAGEDTYLALLAYRRAPRDIGASPAEMLMGRRLRSTMLEPYNTAMSRAR